MVIFVSLLGIAFFSDSFGTMETQLVSSLLERKDQVILFLSIGRADRILKVICFRRPLNMNILKSVVEV